MLQQDGGSQPPTILKAPLEIHASLRRLLGQPSPLKLTFAGRAGHFQSDLVAVDRDLGILALDEMVPQDGDRLLIQGEAVRIEALLDGVRIVWECNQQPFVGQFEGRRCYWLPIPREMLYHQRRGAYRVALKQSELVEVELSGSTLGMPLQAQMLDISATGCRLRFAGNLSDRLQLGQVYEHMAAALPSGTVSLAVKLRHLHYQQQLDQSVAGFRFHCLGGAVQRRLERFVHQLQRQSRRLEL